MNRRNFLSFTLIASTVGLASINSNDAKVHAMKKSPQLEPSPSKIEPFTLDDSEWKKRLSEAQYTVLRDEGTERPFTSMLNAEKRQGHYACAGCGLWLFSSATKYDSGTGWPSFWEPLPDRIGTKTDFKLIFPRTEYHCARCKGHQGHVFNDGPEPTGKRYCNNGVALEFIAAEQISETQSDG